MGGVTDDVLTARAYLSRIAEPACVPLWGLVRDVGPVETVEQLRRGKVKDEKIRSATAARLLSVDPAADLDAAQRHGIRLIVPESDEWPHFAMSALERTGAERLDRYRRGDMKRFESGEPVPPLALWVRGSADLASLGTRSVAIVGARAATSYGEQVAAELAYGLGRRGFVIVSGGAFGIDAAAHRAALGAGGETVIASAGGLDRAYPSSHSELFDRATDRGLLITESPPGASPQRGRFLTRNRIIAALSTGTVVVEAARRSGALNTATHAKRLGRPLMVVPGPVTSAMSIGCHTLLRDDDRAGILVTSIDDVLGVIGSSSDLPALALSAQPTSRADPAAGAKSAGDHVRERLDLLDERARQVYDGLPARGYLDLESVAVTSGLGVFEVIRSLPALELAGLVERAGDGIRRMPAERGR
jgi:DNA processing protein